MYVLFFFFFVVDVLWTSQRYVTSSTAIFKYTVSWAILQHTIYWHVTSHQKCILSDCTSILRIITQAVSSNIQFVLSQIWSIGRKKKKKSLPFLFFSIILLRWYGYDILCSITSKFIHVGYVYYSYPCFCTELLSWTFTTLYLHKFDIQIPVAAL